MEFETDPAVVARLDRLSEACRAAPREIAPQVQLWKAVAALDRWFFINRGTVEAPKPYAVDAAQGAMLCIFSSAERASGAARTSGLIADGEPAPLFGVPLPEAVDWVLAFARGGVVGVVIDHPVLGAWTPLANLERLRTPDGQG
ncbi:hypothetical protein [Nocardioides daejeonensis]|uniref:hypothetical protein n=1 Tax=Nocardioides daejeonensis TaxID=1046556 RepID=UPI000D74A487|nr:hypothetical protein [Nocardioides daejeonensis]